MPRRGRRARRDRRSPFAPAGTPATTRRSTWRTSRRRCRKLRTPSASARTTSCSVIGEGGMGIVYKAEQREPIRRIVALKVIKLGMDTRAGHRALRVRAAGAGADEPPQRRHGARRRRDRDRPAVLRDGVRRRRADHRLRRPPQAHDRASGSSCSSRPATRSSTRTRRRSSTATSSRRTSWSTLKRRQAAA